MAELIGSLLEGIVMSIPTKKNRTVIKKFKILRKESWFKEKYNSALIRLNYSVRNLVEQTDIEKVVNNPEETKKFQIELEKIVKKENL
ncbi:hypothetical protein QTL97_11110 [Sporosarcina thermotolerans]|uniref:Uncharacterized protein n=1 Tax=Sporosarcina thermotolerans TaxID=633404 RepID=A0AAW9ACY2_9BACL|nr:hypothetical protein [Sporosarcina thermotolerans]MDW0117486.1 hypothetical protein [Sporosarcina thermotolerans]WHT49658.1 hypothetical protein QNH10_09255 [Sporosarcina thermotolerans]